MNRRVFFLGLLAAMPGLLSAQETKLVNCRTLEAAGNFIGSDEVLVGDKVCRKLKPGETEPAESRNAETTARRSDFRQRVDERCGRRKS